MLKNRFLTAFAFAGLIGFAACAAEDEGAEFETETAPLEETTPAPEITPQPVTVDTMSTMPADSAATDSATMYFAARGDWRPGPDGVGPLLFSLRSRHISGIQSIASEHVPSARAGRLSPLTPRPVVRFTRRPTILAACAGLVLALGACMQGDGRATRAAAEQLAADSLAARLRADSVAEWQARFGNRVPRPDSVRALYVNGWAAGSRSRMRDLIRIAEETEINAFVIDIKESDTYLVHDSTGIPLAKEIGADQRPASRWLPALVDTLEAHGIYPIARIVVFKDRMLAQSKPELAIRNLEGEVWLDRDGKPWVNPYDRRVWDYNIAIAREALDMGFAEIQWDYVRFPDVTESQRRAMAYPGAGDTPREDNIRNFIAYSKERLAEYRVPVTADVFGLVTYMDGDVGIGQNWEKLIEVADALLPMVYPSHYYAGMYGFQAPNAHPYEIVRVSTQDAVERTEYLRREGKKVGEVMPWLQAMSAEWIDDIQYGPSHLREQIQAVYDSGLRSWTLWNPSSRYDLFLPALRPADGSPSMVERSGWQPPRWELPRAKMSIVIRRREAAERAAAAAAAAAAPADAGE